MQGRFVLKASGRGVGWLLTLLLGSAFPMAQRVLAEPFLEVVTNISQFHGLGAHGQRALCSFRLNAVVCAARSAEGKLILRDDSGDLEVDLDLQGRNLEPGMRVRLEGSGIFEDTSLNLRECPLVNNDGLHLVTELTGKAYIKAGRHPIRVDWFNYAGSYSLDLFYQGPGLPYQRIPANALYHEAVDPKTGSTNFVPGLNYQCYEGSNWNALPDFRRLTPVKRGIATNFDVAVASRIDNVGLEFSGYVEVPRDGAYMVSSSSDDGSKLFLDNPAPPALEVIGVAPAPSPRSVVISQNLPEQEDNQWSEVEGTVTFVTSHEDGCELELSSGAGRMRVMVAEDIARAPLFLLNSLVRVRGICRSTYTSEGQRVAGAVLVGSWSAIEPLQVAAEFWTGTPMEPIGSLVAGGHAATNALIVHVRGKVRSRVGDDAVVLEDGTGRITAEGLEALSAAPGEEVELLGALDRAGTNCVLRRAFCRQVVQVGSGTTEKLPLLTSAKQIHYLSRDEARRKYPVKMRGVVTSTIAWNQSFILQDATHGIFVRGVPQVGVNPPKVGDYYEVEGVTDPGDFAPVVWAEHVTCLGVARLPEPIHPNRDQLINGSLDAQYVELEGVVTAIKPDGITLLTLEGTYSAELFEAATMGLSRYENAMIRIKGCFYVAWDGQSKQIQIGRIRFSNASISVEERAPADVFSAPIKSAGELLHFDARASALKRVRVFGQIVYEHGGEYCLMDGTNGLRFFPREQVQLRTGDSVDVVGFPELGKASPILRDAVVRKTGQAPSPRPQRLAAETILNADYDSTLVEIDSQLVGFRTNQEEQLLELQTGPRTYVARLERGAGLVQPMPMGSRLNLRGVYSGKGGVRTEGRDIESFELLLNSPADVTVLSRPSWWNAQRALAICGLLVGGLLLAATWISVLRRKVEQRTGELRAEMEEHKRAEARLAREIEERKRIEVEVERIHRQLVDASRQAGQAEVASSVLHNVGNVLNSVNVSAEIIVERVRGSKASPGMAKLTELFTGHQKDLPGFLGQAGRAESVVTYLQGITQQLGAERSNLLAELEGITKNIDHIKQIVAMQQSYARVSGVLEAQSLSSLVEDALRMHAASLTRHQVRVVRKFEPIPDVLVDKHKVLQILVNLITNAKWALQNSNAPERILTLGIDVDPESKVRVSVADTGVGISSNDLPRVFTHGFTTRRDGHGFGLHSGILAAKEMGGTLSVQSEGPGKGAVFTLELPFQPKEETA